MKDYDKEIRELQAEKAREAERQKKTDDAIKQAAKELREPKNPDLSGVIGKMGELAKSPEALTIELRDEIRGLREDLKNNPPPKP